MNIYGRFIKPDAQGGIKASRVVPKNTTVEDLKDFKLLPMETLELWESKGRKYVTLKSKILRGHEEMLGRLEAITKYLRALHPKQRKAKV